LRIEASHGAHEKERKASQEFIVDIAVEFDTSKAGTSDKLDDTYDYGLLRGIALEEFAERPRYLIERLAANIADRILEDARITEATVTIRKPHAYPDCVPCVTILRSRASSV
jgi:dihydroneopterin aldolase